MKILLCHPGHTFGPVDVYTGLAAGLEACGVEVVKFEWGQILETLGAVGDGAVKGGTIRPEDAEKIHRFLGYVAAADVFGYAYQHDVDAALIVTGMLFPPDRAKQLQALGIPVACYGTESPYFDAQERQIAPCYTHWFTQERRSLRAFQDVMDGRAFYLPMAYNPAIHQPGPTDPERAVDAVFVGGGFPERKTMLEGVDWTGIDHRVLGTLWHLDLEAEREYAAQGRMVRYAEGAIKNGETAAWHRSATVALNMHRRMTYIETGGSIPLGVAESLGPRAYEIPACGGFMLCDDERPELLDVYGEAAASYRAWDSASLERELRYWLAHPDERERRRRAQFEAVQPHTWAARARTILETIFA